MSEQFKNKMLSTLEEFMAGTQGYHKHPKGRAGTIMSHLGCLAVSNL